MDLSIIIPVYNKSKLINRCLDSIFHQSTQYSYEVILVDDGSTDDSVELIKRRKESNLVLYQQQNAGPSVARNKGVELSHGKYCVYLDADDYWSDGFIEKAVSFLEQHDECVAVNVAQRHMTVSGEHIAPSCYKEYSKPFVLDDFFDFWAKYMHVCTGSVVIRSEVIKQVGGMRTDLRVTEDLEFWALVSTFGNWGFIPEVLFTSDGMDVITSQTDWLKKMQIRWSNAPSVADWEKRIVNRVDQTEAYKKARGRIGRNLVYCQLLSGRTHLARHEALMYGNYFTRDAIGKLMNIAKWTPITWWGLCKLLKWREWHREIIKVLTEIL